MCKRPRRQLLFALLAAAGPLRAAQPDMAAAAGWPQTLASGSSGAARSDALPSAPSVHGACSLTGGILTISWTAVPHATYSVTLSGGGLPLPVTATGLTATSWPQVVTNGTYSFSVHATVGTNWVGPPSTASWKITANGSACSPG